jgi:hypothetical protein
VRVIYTLSSILATSIRTVAMDENNPKRGRPEEDEASKALQKLLDRLPSLEQTVTIVITGSVGDGKSFLANMLLGVSSVTDPDRPMPSSPGGTTITNVPTYSSCVDFLHVGECNLEAKFHDAQDILRSFADWHQCSVYSVAEKLPLEYGVATIDELISEANKLLPHVYRCSIDEAHSTLSAYNRLCLPENRRRAMIRMNTDIEAKINRIRVQARKSKDDKAFLESHEHGLTPVCALPLHMIVRCFYVMIGSSRDHPIIVVDSPPWSELTPLCARRLSLDADIVVLVTQRVAERTDVQHVAEMLRHRIMTSASDALPLIVNVPREVIYSEMITDEESPMGLKWKRIVYEALSSATISIPHIHCRVNHMAARAAIVRFHSRRSGAEIKCVVASLAASQAQMSLRASQYGKFHDLAVACDGPDTECAISHTEFTELCLQHVVDGFMGLRHANTDNPMLHTGPSSDTAIKVRIWQIADTVIDTVHACIFGSVLNGWSRKCGFGGLELAYAPYEGISARAAAAYSNYVISRRAMICDRGLRSEVTAVLMNYSFMFSELYQNRDTDQAVLLSAEIESAARRIVADLYSIVQVQTTKLVGLLVKRSVYERAQVDPSLENNTDTPWLLRSVDRFPLVPRCVPRAYCGPLSELLPRTRQCVTPAQLKVAFVDDYSYGVTLSVSMTAEGLVVTGGCNPNPWSRGGSHARVFPVFMKYDADKEGVVSRKWAAAGYDVFFYCRGTPESTGVVGRPATEGRPVCIFFIDESCPSVDIVIDAICENWTVDAWWHLPPDSHFMASTCGVKTSCCTRSLMLKVQSVWEQLNAHIKRRTVDYNHSASATLMLCGSDETTQILALIWQMAHSPNVFAGVSGFHRHMIEINRDIAPKAIEFLAANSPAYNKWASLGGVDIEGCDGNKWLRRDPSVQEARHSPGFYGIHAVRGGPVVLSCPFATVTKL